MSVKYFLLALIAFPVWAGDLQVIAPRYTYKFNWNEEAFYFESARMKLSMQRKPCNEHILKKLTHQMRYWESGEVKGFKKADVRYIINGKNREALSKSKVGRGLASLPIEIERMKMEEKIICR